MDKAQLKAMLDENERQLAIIRKLLAYPGDLPKYLEEQHHAKIGKYPADFQSTFRPDRLRSEEEHD